MVDTLDREELLKLCRGGEHDQAVALAFHAGDAIAMLVASIFELGSHDRLKLLLQTEEGPPSLGTEITLADVEDYDADAALTQLAFAALDEHREQLGLTADQVDRALKRINLADDPLAPKHGATILRWVASNHTLKALGFAREHVAEAAVGSPNALELAAVGMLGQSANSEDHAALPAYAEEYLEASPRS